MTWKRFAMAVVLVAALGLSIPVGVGAAVTYFHTTVTVHGQGRVVCPAGYRVTGGGYKVATNTYTASDTREYFVSSSLPDTATSWKVTGYEIESDGNRDVVVPSRLAYVPAVYAVCVK